jgi:hypothetical protein
MDLPNELWIHIFRQMEPDELYEKRKVSRHFRDLIDVHMTTYLREQEKRKPHFFAINNNEVSKNNFLKGALLEKIVKLSEITLYCFFKLKLPDIPLDELILVHKLVSKHNVQIFFAKYCGNFSQKQIDNILALKKHGFPDFYSVKYGRRDSMSLDKMDTVKRLTSMGISDYFCGKIVTEFTPAQQELFFELKEKTDLYYVNIANIIQNQV